ncbi:MAG: zinc ribbon domain-containing protein [Weeksellaceae bacterium]
MAKKAKSDVTVEEKLRALYDLQLIDSRLDEIRNTRGELPLEVQDLEDDIIGLEKRNEKTQEEIKSLEKDIAAKKEAIKHSESLMKKYTKQQDNVRNNREFEALAKEIEYQELEIQLSEKRIKEYKSKIEHKNEATKEIDEKLTSYRDHLAHKKSELEKIVEETKKEEDTLKAKAEEFSSNIDERLLKAYNKIRASVKNGLAVVPVERGASAGSYFTIPAQRQMEIALRKKIISDEHSGRILVDAELAAEEKEKMSAIIHG